MLRIEAEARTHETTIRATGRLAGPWVDELRRSLASERDRSVVLDLTDVSFVDRDGIEFLRTLRREARVNLRCSAFVSAQLM
jgi:anti-anti-sigma regulatory factor